jgi:hypothetical protein
LKPKLKAPVTRRWTLKCEQLLSIFAFNFNFRYIMAPPKARARLSPLRTSGGAAASSRRTTTAATTAAAAAAAVPPGASARDAAIAGALGVAGAATGAGPGTAGVWGGLVAGFDLPGLVDEVDAPGFVDEGDPPGRAVQVDIIESPC